MSIITDEANTQQKKPHGRKQAGGSQNQIMFPIESQNMEQIIESMGRATSLKPNWRHGTCG